MLKYLACAIALATCCAAASARTWDFSYQGFQDAASGVFYPAWRLDGRFSGSDRDGDGAIALDELSSLTIDRIDYLPCSDIPYFSCTAHHFSYVPGGALHFGVDWSAYDEAVSWSGAVEAGVGIASFTSYPGHYEQSNMIWTPATRFQILQQVPEPATWSMGAAALYCSQALPGVGGVLSSPI